MAKYTLSMKHRYVFDCKRLKRIIGQVSSPLCGKETTAVRFARTSLVFLLMLCSAMVSAQQVEVTLTEAGTLSEKIASDQKYEITSLKVSGPINGTDVRYLREMAGQNVWGDSISGKLVELNLANANIVNGGNYYYSDRSYFYYTKEDTLGYYMFSGCRLKSIKLPNSVTCIGKRAFRCCSSLMSVDIPNSVTDIGERAFASCFVLASVTIPDSVTNIGESAFAECKSLTAIDIPNTVTSISDGTFFWCFSLVSVTIPNSVTSIGNSAFIECKSLMSIDIPNSVTSIGGNAFNGCISLTSIAIPNSVTSIGGSAFYGCTSLTSIAIPNSVTSIDYSVFGRCSSLTSITIPNSVTSIGNYAFNGCTSLTSIAIPNSVTSIGNDAFFYCTGLKEVILQSKTLPTCAWSVFGGLPSDAMLYCKSSLVETCKNTNPWSSFKNIEALPLSLTITSAGIATACFDEDLDFMGLDMKAYIASGFNPETGKVLLTRAMQIPAGTGFIVKGNEGTYNLSAATTKYTYANLLVGTLEETSLSAVDGSYSNYVLRNDATLGVGFHTPVDGYVLPANKAYLRIPTSVSEAKSVMGLCFDGEDDTTGFIPVRKLTEGTNGQSAVYDLNGQRKQGLSKGLNIVNGKKILVK